MIVGIPKKVKKTYKDDDIVRIFNQMMGKGNPDPSIVIPKHNKMLTTANEILRILETFSRSPYAELFLQVSPNAQEEILNFVNTSYTILKSLELEKNQEILTGEALNKLNADQKKLQEYMLSLDFQYKIENLGVKYEALKNSIPIKEITMIAKNIKIILMLEKERTNADKHNLEDKTQLSYDFIKNAEGDYISLFNFTTLDFKQLYYFHSDKDDLLKYTLMTLYLVYKKSITIIKDLTSPDIDIEKCSDVLVNHIIQAKKAIPRCERAFNKIKESVGLLKSNFNSYYKDFVVSRNPTIMIENFVMDVANNTEADASTLQQFNTIVMHYRKKLGSAVINNPEINKLLSVLEENMALAEDTFKNKEGDK